MSYYNTNNLGNFVNQLSLWVGVPIAIVEYYPEKIKKRCTVAEKRYAIIDANTHQIINDCNGYGFKSEYKAGVGFYYYLKNKIDNKIEQTCKTTSSESPRAVNEQCSLF